MTRKKPSRKKKHREEPAQTLSVVPHILIFLGKSGEWVAARESEGLWATGASKEEALYSLVDRNKEALGLDLTVIDDPNHLVTLRRRKDTGIEGNYYVKQGATGSPIWGSEYDAKPMPLEEGVRLAKSLGYARPLLENYEPEN